ncbi:MAG: type 1 glutamine amidotransferase [Pseudoclavibacter sp.]
MPTSPATPSPRVLVVVNSAGSAPRRLPGWLGADGVELDIRNGWEGLPASLDGYDGLIMMGGGFMPDDDDRAPWLPVERSLAEQAIATDLSTLGICLGGQLLAQVSGGIVRAAYGEPERGSTLVRTTAAGAADPVFAAFAPSVYVVENHQDRITRLPDGAVLLASSAVCEIQGFRLGAHVRGTQFHPEVCGDDLRGWDEASLARDGLNRNELVADARAHDPDNAARCRRLIDAFAAETTGRPSGADKLPGKISAVPSTADARGDTARQEARG